MKEPLNNISLPPTFLMEVGGYCGFFGWPLPRAPDLGYPVKTH